MTKLGRLLVSKMSMALRLLSVPAKVVLFLLSLFLGEGQTFFFLFFSFFSRLTIPRATSVYQSDWSTANCTRK